MNEYTLMPGKPFEGTEEETLQTIREILTEELTAEPKPRRGAKAFMQRSTAAAQKPRRRSEDFPVLQDVPQVELKSVKKRKMSGHLERRLRRVTAFRPTTRHLAIVSTLLLVVVRPQWFAFGALVAIVLTTALFLTFGAQRIWRAVQRGVERIERKDAERGAALRVRLDRFACRWDGLLDMLPDGMADDLYMPDFLDANRDKDAELDRVVTDRLNRMVEGN